MENPKQFRSNDEKSRMDSPEEILRASAEALQIYKIGTATYVDLCKMHPENRDFFEKLNLFHQQQVELTQFRLDLQTEIRMKNCSSFLPQLASLFNRLPMILELKTSAPNRVFRTLALEFFPEKRFLTPFLVTYNTWYQSLRPETQCLHFPGYLLQLHFYLEMRATNTGTVFVFSYDHRVIFWKNKIYWAKKGKLPGVVVSDLRACGLNDAQICMLYPGFHA